MSIADLPHGALFRMPCGCVARRGLGPFTFEFSKWHRWWNITVVTQCDSHHPRDSTSRLCAGVDITYDPFAQALYENFR